MNTREKVIGKAVHTIFIKDLSCSGIESLFNTENIGTGDLVKIYYNLNGGGLLDR
jgi:hypothetical protein